MFHSLSMAEQLILCTGNMFLSEHQSLFSVVSNQEKERESCTELLHSEHSELKISTFQDLSDQTGLVTRHSGDHENGEACCCCVSPYWALSDRNSKNRDRKVHLWEQTVCTMNVSGDCCDFITVVWCYCTTTRRSSTSCWCFSARKKLSVDTDADRM